MPFSENWPFKRLFVDHMFHGTTRVWWSLSDSFNKPQPHEFQLQAGYTGSNDSLDWVNIGDPATNAYYLEDGTARERTGKRILTHYRVLLTADGETFVSNPQGVFSVLDAKDWNLAKEIVRKERLRHDKVSSNGYIIKKMRHGARSDANTDLLTGEIIDSGYKGSWGTAYKVGYHPPVPMSVDFDGEYIVERRGGDNIAAHSSRPTEFTARVIAFPDLAKEDVWVDADTDQRWAVHDIKLHVGWRGVPLVYTVKMRLIPHSEVIYEIPVSEQSYDPGDTTDFQATTGDGCVRVDHDYKEESNFVYQTEDCCGIEGATIMAFTKSDWDGGARTEEHAAATSQTIANGLWGWAMMLDPGDYVLQFSKPGEYGPDTVEFTVDVPGPPPAPDSSSTDSDFSSSFGSF